MPVIKLIDSKTKEVTRNPNYWVIKHYNHAARRGARVVRSDGTIEKVAHVAFLNPDGRKCLVLSNTGARQTVQVYQAGAAFDIDLQVNGLWISARLYEYRSSGSVCLSMSASRTPAPTQDLHCRLSANALLVHCGVCAQTDSC